jgi:hypothetical protein
MPNMDMPQMEKAKKITQMRLSPATSGKLAIPKFSIVNIPNDEIGHRAERLGISLGCLEREVENSIKDIKLLEENRVLTLFHNKSHVKDSEEEDLSSLVMSKVSTLWEDLVEEDIIPLGVDDDIELLKPVVRARKPRQKKCTIQIILEGVIGSELRNYILNAEHKRIKLESGFFLVILLSTCLLKRQLGNIS